LGDDGADVVGGVAWVGAFALVFEEDGVGAAEVLFEVVVAFFGGKSSEVGGAIFAFGDRDYVVHFGGGSTFSFGIGEDVGVGKGAFEEGLAGFFEEFGSFSREADEDVGTDAEIGDGFVGEVNKVEEFAEVVLSAHGFENGVGAGLEWDVEVRKEGVFRIRHAGEEFGGDGGGFDAGDADAGESWEFVEGVGDVYDGVAGVVVGAEVDSGEDEFADSSGDQVLGIFHKVGKVSGSGSASGERDDAKGAHEVTAVLNFEVGSLGEWEVTDEGDGEVISVDLVTDDDWFFVFGVAEVVEYVVLFLVSNDEVNAFDLGNFFVAHLGIAADDCGDGIGVATCELPNGGAGFGVGNAGDRAGIDNGEVGFFFKGHDGVTLLDQLVADVVGFGLVEPTAECVQCSFGSVFGVRGHGRKVGF